MTKVSAVIQEFTSAPRVRRGVEGSDEEIWSYNGEGGFVAILSQAVTYG